MARLHCDAMLVRLLLLGFTLLTGLVAPRARAEAQSSSYLQLVNEAIEAQQQGEFVRARQLFSDAHALEPNARTLRGMGVAAFQAGNFQQAVVDLSAALEHPTKPLDGELRTAVVALLAEAQARLEGVSVAPPPEGITPTSPPVGEQEDPSSVQRQPANADKIQTPVSRAPADAPIASLTRVDRRTHDIQLRRASLATLVFGVAMAGGSAALWATGARRAKNIEHACGEKCSEQFVDQQVDRAGLRRIELGFNVLAGSAAVALGTSLGLWLWHRQASKHGTQLGFGGRTLVYSQRF